MKKVAYRSMDSLKYIISYTILNFDKSIVIYIYDKVNQIFYNYNSELKQWNKYFPIKNINLIYGDLNDEWSYGYEVTLNDILNESSIEVKKEILYHMYILECKDTAELKKLLKIYSI